MSDIVKSFDAAFKRMKERNWEKIYILVDIHDTIFEACYHNEEKYKWLPYAKECLQLMTKMENISLILWTSTYENVINKYLDYFNENGIKFDMVNENSETENCSLGCFDSKTYFNVGIDDKFGFDGEGDWKSIYEYLKDYETC